MPGISRSIRAIEWLDAVVPIAVEVGSLDVNRGHVLFGDNGDFRIGVGVKLAVNLDAHIGGRGTDQIDNDAVAYQRLGAPWLRDGRAQAMLDLVPLAGARRPVAYAYIGTTFIGETLQSALPQAQSRAVATNSVRGDQHASGAGRVVPVDLRQSAADCLHRNAVSWSMLALTQGNRIWAIVTNRSAISNRGYLYRFRNQYGWPLWRLILSLRLDMR